MIVFLGAVLLFNALRQQERIKIERAALKLAPLSFAVYLIHDISNVREILWKALPLETIMKSGILPTLASLIAVVAIIFLRYVWLRSFACWYIIFATHKNCTRRLIPYG